MEEHLLPDENFLENRIDVVIDYVAFPSDVAQLKDNLADSEVNIVYVVLWTEKETLLRRDQMRVPEQRMGERSLKLIDEFLQSGLSERYKLDTSMYGPEALSFIIKSIMTNHQYRGE